MEAQLDACLFSIIKLYVIDTLVAAKDTAHVKWKRLHQIYAKRNKYFYKDVQKIISKFVQ